MDLRHAAIRGWHRLRRPLTRHALPYRAVNALRPSRRGLMVRPDSALLIEGPMRSGNTYAVAAFRVANGHGPHVGRHMHAPAHVRLAVQYGVPALVLLRDPADVCLSHVIRRPALDLVDSLRDYVDFYATIRPVRDRLVVAEFEQVVWDMGGVIEAVNRRFGTDFALFPGDEAAERAATVLVEEMNRAETGGTVVETLVARPSEERDRMKEGLRSRLERQPVRRFLSEARSVYDDWRRYARELREDPGTLRT